MKTFVKYPPDCDFSIQNLPFGIFSTEKNSVPRIGVAIGDEILDMKAITPLFTGIMKENEAVFHQETLNDFMGVGRPLWKETRKVVQELLSINNATLQENLRDTVFVPQEDAIMHLPVDIGDYTDFYSSINHATNVGKMFRGVDKALMPNWRHIPVAYHGRSSTVVVSGTPIRRPYGQTNPFNNDQPVLGPSKAMDFELEVGFFVGGKPNNLGDRIPMEEAEDHIFGFVLMNDWSARDIQKWEYVPLGPFLSKNLGTSISPWVVTVEALEAFKVDNMKQDPLPFEYLRHSDKFNFDIQLSVDIQPQNCSSTRVSSSNFKYLYWTPKQQVVHHSMSGCVLNPGDLMGSGTISGETEDSCGSLLEITLNGTKPITLSDENQRKYLLDGDKVIIKGYCQGADYRVGFGACIGKILPCARNSPK